MADRDAGRQELLPSLEDFGWFDEGRGVPVLFLHSSGSSRRQWTRLREPWRDRCRALGLDLWGYGETPMPPDESGFRLDREADLARALLSRIDEPFHIVGHSYGGAVGLRLALDSPERVLSVSVHEPVLFHLLREAGCREEWAEISQVSQVVLHSVERRDFAGGAQQFVDYWNGEGAWRMLTPQQQERMAVFARKAPLDFTALFAETAPLERFGSLAGKVLVTAGERTRRPGGAGRLPSWQRSRS